MDDAAPARIETIFSAKAIAERIEALAADIAGAGLQDLLAVAVLKGSFVFAADLIRALHRVHLSPEVDFISLSSYRAGTRSLGRIRSEERRVGKEGRAMWYMDEC